MELNNDRINYSNILEFTNINNLTLGDLKVFYKESCDANDSEYASKYCRAIRDKLLEETDKELLIDRIGLQVPSTDEFNDWLVFLKQLSEFVSNDVTEYRQELRDIPEKEGFPFNIEFPEKPLSPSSKETE